MNLLLPMVKQLVVHFKLTKQPHVENVPKMPVDTDETLEEVERFFNTNTNFEYMVIINFVIVIVIFSNVQVR